MNISARIRKIEEPDKFKRFFNTLMGAEYVSDFEPTKEWHDFGLDGYLKSKKIAYAVYCPQYPERTSQKQYKDKIKSDIENLAKAIEYGDITVEIGEWCFVTPGCLSVEIKEYIKMLTTQFGWGWSTLTAPSLAPLLLKHTEIYKDFPEIIPETRLNTDDSAPELTLKTNYTFHSNIKQIDIIFSLLNNGKGMAKHPSVFIGFDNIEVTYFHWYDGEVNSFYKAGPLINTTDHEYKKQFIANPDIVIHPSSELPIATVQLSLPREDSEKNHLVVKYKILAEGMPPNEGTITLPEKNQ